MSSILPNEAVVARSLVEAWRSDVASPAELRRGYGRFTRKPPARQALLRLMSGVALGLLLGVGLAQASSIARARWFAARDVTLRPSGKSPLASRSDNGALAPLIPQPDLPGAQQPPAPVRNLPAADRAPRVALPSSSSSAPHVQQQWQQAAAALRAKDFARAQSALLEVERSGGERDAARLARAQLLSSRGRTADAIALLSDLSAHAQSRLVREQSVELLARLAKDRGAERSTEAPPEFKQP
jgi:hypothetical protein